MDQISIIRTHPSRLRAIRRKQTRRMVWLSAVMYCGILVVAFFAGWLSLP